MKIRKLLNRKQLVIKLFFLVSLFLLTACAAGLKDGTYKDENGYILTVSGNQVELNALIATGTGTIKGKTIEMDTSFLGLTSGTQTLTYKVNGKGFDVTDESGNVMHFKPIEEDEAVESVADKMKNAVGSLFNRDEDLDLDGVYYHDDGFVITIDGSSVEAIGWPFTDEVDILKLMLKVKLDSNDDFRWLYYSKGSLSGDTITLEESFYYKGKSPKLTVKTVKQEANGIILTDEVGNSYTYYKGTDLDTKSAIYYHDDAASTFSDGDLGERLGDEMVAGNEDIVGMLETWASYRIKGSNTDSSSKKQSLSSAKNSKSSSKESASSAQTETESGRTEVTVAELAGIWENAEGYQWEITADGLIKSSDSVYRFEEDKITEVGSSIGGTWSIRLLEEDGSTPIAPLTFFLEFAGQSITGDKDNSDISRERFLLAVEGGRTYFNTSPNRVFYKVDGAQASTKIAESSTVSLSDFAGTWKSEKFGTLVIDKQGRATDESGAAKYDIYELEGKSQAAFEAWPLNSDGSKKLTGGAATYFLPAGSIKYQPKSDSTKDRLYFSQATPDYELDVAEIYYRVDSKTTNTSKKKSSSESSSSQAVWNDSKSKQLAQFMVDWGNGMNQPNYQELTGKYVLLWQGNIDQGMDVAYDKTGRSSAEYTVVAAYQYSIDSYQAHRYFFAFRQDGSPVVFYSQNGRNYVPINFEIPAGYDDFVFNLVGETGNQDLIAGFTSIANQ